MRICPSSTSPPVSSGRWVCESPNIPVDLDDLSFSSPPLILDSNDGFETPFELNAGEDAHSVLGWASIGQPAKAMRFGETLGDNVCPHADNGVRASEGDVSGSVQYMKGISGELCTAEDKCTYSFGTYANASSRRRHCGFAC